MKNVTTDQKGTEQENILLADQFHSATSYLESHSGLHGHPPNSLMPAFVFLV